MTTKLSLRIIFMLLTIQQIKTSDEGYLRYVKDGCLIRGEALSCVKYKALKIAKKTIFGNSVNETIRAYQMFSFVPLEDVSNDVVLEETNVLKEEPRGFFSEWAELTKYIVNLVKDFMKVKGLRVDLPDGARSIEEETDDGGRAKKKKLAIIIPLLTLLAAVKAKLLLIPILLTVLLIKKLLLIAALLLPSLLSTLKSCKHHHHSAPAYSSFFGSSDSSDFSSDYGNSYAYSANGGYGKDWASNRAYMMSKPRPTPSPVFITAPGGVS